GVMTACGNQPAKCLAQDKDEQKTCWDEQTKAFSCPAQMFTYAYRSAANGTSYELYGNLEFADSWKTSATNYTLPFYGNAAACQDLNFEIHQSKTKVSVPAPADCAIKYCWGANGLIIQNGSALDCSANVAICPANSRCTGDADSDGVCDEGLTDNCSPKLDCSRNPKDCYNPDQRDSDGNGKGDACDNNCSADRDNDSICDEADNCKTVKNREQTDSDNDGIGDACDPCTDVDADGYWDIDTGANDAKVCPKDNCAPADSTGNNCDPNSSAANKCTNAKQIDSDNDGLGDVCDQCLDFDQDGMGDYSFFTHNLNSYSAANLSASQIWQLVGCHGNTTGNYAPFDFTPIAENVAPFSSANPRFADASFILDNCPGGPYGATCYDQFGIKIACANPPVAEWTDENNDKHFNSQADRNLNFAGDICDQSGDGLLDEGEACDCGSSTLSRDPNNPFVCTTLNNVACIHSMRYGDCCSYCRINTETGENEIAQSCGPSFGDCEVNGAEECDCCATQAQRNSLITDPSQPGLNPDVNGITCLSAAGTAIYNNVACGPVTDYSTDGVSCSYCSQGRIVEQRGPYFGDGTVQDTYETCDCGSQTISTNAAIGCNMTCTRVDPTSGANIEYSCQNICGNDPVTGQQVCQDVPCITGCSSLNDTACKPGLNCDATCAYCSRKPNADNTPNGANEGGLITYAGGLCFACSSSSCDATCVNTPNDGCCRDGETFFDDYACPIRVGDTIKIATVPNNEGCGTSYGRPFCHPESFLGAYDRFLTVPGIFAVANNLLGFQFVEADSAKCKNTSSVPTVGEPIINGSCVGIRAMGKDLAPAASRLKFGSIVDMFSGNTLSGKWLTIQGDANDSWDTWKINIRSLTNPVYLTLGSSISIQSANIDNSTGDDTFWSARWSDFFNGGKGPIGQADAEKSWEKFKICTREGFCSTSQLLAQQCAADSDCTVNNPCSRCVTVRDNYKICSDTQYAYDNLTQTYSESPVLSCSGATEDLCCPAGCVFSDDTSAAAYDKDCSALKVGTAITLKAFDATEGMESRIPTFLFGGRAASDSYVRRKASFETAEKYYLSPAAADTCGGSGESLPMPGKGPGWSEYEGGRDYFKEGDCLSFKNTSGNYIGMECIGNWALGCWNGEWLKENGTGNSFKVHTADGSSIKYGSVITLQAASMVEGQGTGDYIGTNWGSNEFKVGWDISSKPTSREFKVCDEAGRCEPECQSDNDCGTCFKCQNPGQWTSQCQADPSCNYDQSGNACTDNGHNDGCCAFGSETVDNESACAYQSGDTISLRYDSQPLYLSANDSDGGQSIPYACVPGGPALKFDWRLNRTSVSGDWEKYLINKCDKTKTGCVHISGPLRYGDVVELVSKRNSCPLMLATNQYFAWVPSADAWFPSSTASDVEFGDDEKIYLKLCSSVTSGGCAEGNGVGQPITKGDLVDFEKGSWHATDGWVGVGKWLYVNGVEAGETGDKDNPVYVSGNNSDHSAFYMCDTNGFCNCQESGMINCGGTCQEPMINNCVEDQCNTYTFDVCQGCQLKPKDLPQCSACSESNCQASCSNSSNDGCCKNGETIQNEYACPIVAGDCVSLYSLSAGYYLDKFTYSGDQYVTVSPTKLSTDLIISPSDSRNQNFNNLGDLLADGSYFGLGTDDANRICSRNESGWWLSNDNCDKYSFSLHLLDDKKSTLVGIQPGSIVGLESGWSGLNQCFEVQTSGTWKGWLKAGSCSDLSSETKRFRIEACNGNKVP
ncbi:MAG: thrombospondin type 3 repeat-containing protein, partial [Candidatus Buchananbacteria bacterium]